MVEGGQGLDGNSLLVAKEAATLVSDQSELGALSVWLLGKDG